MGSEVVVDVAVFLVRVIRGVFCGAATGFFVVFIVGIIAEILFDGYGKGKTGTRQPDDHSDVSAIELYYVLAALVGTIIGLVIGIIVEFVV